MLATDRFRRADVHRRARGGRTLTWCAGVVLAVGLAACGSQPKVGDCIDSQKQVVDCKSPSATLRLVSNQSGPTAIACIEINDKPQISVKVGGSTFCAESVSASH